MTQRRFTRSVIAAVALAFGVCALSSNADALQNKGRYKKEGNTCVWDANDSGPNQCTPIVKGRFKKQGTSCTWASTENGPDQCRPPSGRFKKEGENCVWTANDSGPDQCNPRTPK